MFIPTFRAIFESAEVGAPQAQQQPQPQPQQEQPHEAHHNLKLKFNNQLYKLNHNPEDAPAGGDVDDANDDSEETDSDSDFDPVVDRGRIAINKRAETATGVSRRIKMIARSRKKKTRGPPLESSSKGKRKKTTTDKDYSPQDDLVQYKSKKAEPKRFKVS
ncbi:hypothetical protein L1987_08720 [Smallanthus sonchifolius]|uniref:Uncharacterized protein n=1 Tax=Smallanthus sonchifolius TaxID=185202 RepID=A0ACB9JND1_9ASTR|nr:hypothetical protein L1987_08720 [Smallanthus sonchifolius]